MAIDLNSEELLSLADAARALPKVGSRRPHTSTVWRWAKKGLRGVRLEYVRLGHRVCTSRQALGRFAQRLADVDELQSNEGATIIAPVAQTNAQREKAIDRANAELDRAGIK